VGNLDTRGSHFYLTLYWANELAEQSDDVELKALFSEMSTVLSANEQQIADELKNVQGKGVDVGGYYKPNDDKAFTAMRPSATFNKALDLMA